MQSFSPTPRPVIFEESVSSIDLLSQSLIPAPLAIRQSKSTLQPGSSINAADHDNKKETARNEAEIEIFEGKGRLTPVQSRRPFRATTICRFRSTSMQRRPHSRLRAPGPGRQSPRYGRNKCSFCSHSITAATARTIGHDARVACPACWKRLWDLAVCWACGEMIIWEDDGRLRASKSQADVVSLGWCFWHRSCFGCLLCHSPMPVPAGVPGVGRGVQLEDVPVCARCDAKSGDNGHRKRPGRGIRVKSRSGELPLLPGTDGASGDATVDNGDRRLGKEWYPKQAQGFGMSQSQYCKKKRGFKGLETAMPAKTADEGIPELKKATKLLPSSMAAAIPIQSTRPAGRSRWMALLPSNRDPTIQCLGSSQLPSAALNLFIGTRTSSEMKSQTSTKDLTGVTSSSTYPAHIPLAAIEYLSSLPAGERIARTQSSSTVVRSDENPEKEAPPFPFFQNPRAPIVPSIDSSWGRTSKSSSFQSCSGIGSVHSHCSGIERHKPITSAEYKERYIDSPKRDAPLAKVCILCGQSSTSDKFVVGPNEKTYHHSCFTCRVCNKVYNPLKDSTDSYICFGVFPSHRRCISNRADVLLARLQAQ